MQRLEERNTKVIVKKAMSLSASVGSNTRFMDYAISDSIFSRIGKKYIVV